MNAGEIAGVAEAQRVTREVIHEVSETVRPGDTELEVAGRIDERLVRAGGRGWLHTAYAWWGERTRFAGFVDWEPDALPTARRLQEGEPFILDAAPLLDGYPADYALSGIAGKGGDAAKAHTGLLRALVEIKAAVVAWARAAATGAELYDVAAADIAKRHLDAIHPMYPGNVLGHRIQRVPKLLAAAPRIGDGFQLPIVGLSLFQLVENKVKGAPFPFLSPMSKTRPVGIFAVEPHLADGEVGAKFESMLVVDGDETRWLDPTLFGEVRA